MAKEILKYMKKIIITLFIFCFLEFIALVIMTILYIRLNNDIGVIETTTNQEVTQDNTNGDNNFIGNDGDINYGKANSEN
jgi:bacteriorhodopsin